MIRWITSRLGTAAWGDVASVEDAHVLDVRDLVDKGGNLPSHVRHKIDEGVAELARGKRVVIVCDYGMSRSNAIAAGVIAVSERKSLDRALSQVVVSTGETSIKLEMVTAVRQSLEPEGPDTTTTRHAVLVTGGRGFVGARLASRLGNRTHVIAPSRQEADLARGSLALDRIVREEGVGTMVHLAYPRGVSSNVSLGEAATAMKNLLDVCGENHLRLVYLSGWEVFSGYEDASPVLADETLQPRPASTYGYSKLVCETLATQIADRLQFPLCLLRSGPVLGPESDRPRFIRTFVAQAVRDEPIIVHRYRNDLPRLDLMHVDDLVAGMASVVELGAVGTFHFGSGQLTSTTTIAERVVRLLKSNSVIVTRDIESDVCNVALETSKAQEDLGWRIRIPPDQAVDALVGDISRQSSRVPLRTADRSSRTDRTER